MSNFLKKPSLRKNITFAQGSAVPEHQPLGAHYTQPLPTNVAIPEKSEELKKVEEPDSKVVAARDRKNRAQGKKPSGSSRPLTHGKRGRETSSGRGNKRSRLSSTDAAYIDLDEAESVQQPQPIRSIPATAIVGEEGGSGELDGGSEAGGSRGKKPMIEGNEEQVEGEAEATEDDEALFVPSWEVARGSRMNNSTICRDMMVNLATPAEERYINSYSDVEAIQRAWLLLGKQSTAQADLILRFETLMGSQGRLAESNQELRSSLDEYKKKCEDVTSELAGLKEEHAGCVRLRDPEELAKLKAEHAGCSDKEAALKDRISELEREKEEWRGVSAAQAESIKTLTSDLEKAKTNLAEEERLYHDMAVAKDEIAVRAGLAEIDRNRIIKEFLPEMVRRLLDSYEYKVTLAEPFNLFSNSGFLDGLKLGREPEDVEKLLEQVEDIDVEAGKKYPPLYDALFVKDYPYVQKVANATQRTFEDLMRMDPAPEATDDDTAASVELNPKEGPSSSTIIPSSDTPTGSAQQQSPFV